jgi:adenylyltransferase/sulfurtransferase
MAAEALKLVTGTGRSLLGRLLVYEGLGGTWREIRVRPAGERPAVTELVDYEAFCGVGPGRGVQARPGDEVTAPELAALLADRERGAADFVLVDVREPWEREIVAIPGAVPVPVGGIRSGEALPGLAELAAGRRVVLHCKSGGRSAEALALLRSAGFADAVHLAGGVLAWVEDVDPGQDTY